MASTKEKTKFLQTIDHLVDGYKDVKSKSLEYMKDYGQENLKKDLIESLLRFRQLSDDMLNFICPGGLEQEESEIEESQAIQDPEVEEESDCEDDEIEAEEWVEGVEDEEDELAFAGRVLRQRFGDSALFQVIGAESLKIRDLSESLIVSADDGNTEEVNCLLAGIKENVDNMATIWGDGGSE